MMTRRYRQYDTFEVIVFVVIGLMFLLVAVEAAEQFKHGGCAVYRKTERLMCYGSGNLTTCEPERVCVRWGDGTTPWF
jgi:hypothetical protein